MDFRKRKTVSTGQLAPKGAPPQALIGSSEAIARVMARLERIESDSPKDKRCRLVDLQTNSCRWPLGDPSTDEFRFCGDDQMTGAPYCAYHARVAYTQKP
jgi:GcrA cell cycle regulator